MVASFTRIIVSMHFLAISKVIEPFSIPPERPSAIVFALGTSIILPALRDSYMTGDASDWTPTSLTLGLRLFMAMLMPEIQPPRNRRRTRRGLHPIFLSRQP